MPVTGAIPIVMPTLMNTWKRKANDDPAGDNRAVQVSRNRDHTQTAPHDEQVQQEQDRGADEPSLLRERGEDEVGGMLGKVVEAGLARALDAATREATGTDCCSRLRHVVRQPARIAVGVREPRQAGGLVRLEHLDARRRQKPQHAGHEHDRTDPEHRQVQPAHPGEKQHCGQSGTVDEGRAEIGLEEDEPHRHEAEADRGSHGAELARRDGHARRGSRRSPERRRACRTRTAGTEKPPDRSSASSRAPPRRRRRRRSSPRSCRRTGTSSGADRRTAG